MIEREIDIPTVDGRMNTFFVHPDAPGRYPVVLFYMDAPGKREELHDMARRIAAVGYLVLLPNLYYRRSRDYVLRDRSEAAMTEMYAQMDALGRATTECDTAALLDCIDAHPHADSTRVAAVGYCMSGPFVVWAAGAFPDRFKSIASIYGARLVTDAAASPHRRVDRVRCEAYFACAEHDRWASPEQIAQLEAALAAAGTPHRLDWYPGAQHGFAFPLRAGVYDQPSAERHWERLFELFRRTLGPAGAVPG